MKFVVGKNSEKTYTKSVSSTTQPTWSDRDANSGPPLVGGERLTACAMKLRLMILILCIRYRCINF